MDDAADNGIPIPTLDRGKLTDIVRKALDNEMVELLDWQINPLDFEPLMPTTGGLYRVAGTARDHGEHVSWSLILKVLVSSKPYDDPSHPYYWKREALAYQSGLLTVLPRTFAAPQCFAVEAPSPETAWIWLEEVRETSSTSWPIERHGLAGRHLGDFSSAYLAGRPLPTYSWLSRHWLRASTEWLDERMRLLQQLPMKDRQLARRALTPLLYDRIAQFLSRRATLLESLDRLPRTLCHLDVKRGNLLARHDPNGNDQTVALDWSFIGHGAVGEDAGAYLAASLFSFEVEPIDAAALDEIIYGGYLTGLNDTDYGGDAAVRFGYVTAATMRGASHMLVLLPYALQERLRDFHEELYGRPVQDLVEGWGEALAALYDLAGEFQGFRGHV
jgi:hypothetical protein